MLGLPEFPESTSGDTGDSFAMRLWIIEPRDGVIARSNCRKENPWWPPEDKYYGFVVAAPTEARARHLAHLETKDNHYSDHYKRGVFLDPEWTSCEVLTDGSEEAVIMSNFYHG